MGKRRKPAANLNDAEPPKPAPLPSLSRQELGKVMKGFEPFKINEVSSGGSGGNDEPPDMFRTAEPSGNPQPLGNTRPQIIEQDATGGAAAQSGGDSMRELLDVNRRIESHLIELIGLVERGMGL